MSLFGKFKFEITSPDIINTIRRIIIYSTLLITIGVASIIMLQQYLLFNRLSNQKREEYLDKQNEFIKIQTNIEIDYILDQKVKLISTIKSDLANNVNNAYNIASELYEEYHGILPDQLIKEIIINSVSVMSGISPYAHVFINGMDGTGIFYLGRPQLSGTNLSDFEDINGNKVITREIDFLKDQKEGYIIYNDDKLIKSDTPKNKVTFVKKFEPYNWYFGSKSYLEDYYAIFLNEITKKISSEKLRYGGDVMLSETDGTTIIYNYEILYNTKNVSTDTMSIISDIFNKQVEIVKSNNGEGYVYYQLHDDKNNESENFVSFAKKIEDTNWIISTSFNVNEVEGELYTQNKELRTGLFYNLLEILFVLLIIIAIEILIIYQFQKKFTSDFNLFSHFFKKGLEKGNFAKIDVEKLNFDEFKNMGIVANEMVDEKSEVQEQLILEQKKAQEADRLKTAFLANMSHEIRTPMNAIIGFSELLNEEDISLKDKKLFMKLIVQNGNILLRLINDIIDIAKIEAGQLNISKRHFNLNELLENIRLQHQEFTYPDFKSSISFILENNVPTEFTLYSDEFRLKQVLDNLVSNAVKFTNEGYIKLTASKNGHNIDFRVTDTGIGIHENELNLIFDRFVQAKNDSKHSYGGTGLGLAISKNIIILLGGEIGVKSFPGKGSEFFITIPYSEVSAAKFLELTNKN